MTCLDHQIALGKRRLDSASRSGTSLNFAAATVDGSRCSPACWHSECSSAGAGMGLSHEQAPCLYWREVHAGGPELRMKWAGCSRCAQHGSCLNYS